VPHSDLLTPPAPVLSTTYTPTENIQTKLKIDDIKSYRPVNISNAASAHHGSQGHVAAATSSGDMWTERAMYCINLAQIIANNPKLLRLNDRSYLESIQEQAIQCANASDELFAVHSVSTADYYRAVIDDMG
jgi:hypothetical protein